MENAVLASLFGLLGGLAACALCGAFAAFSRDDLDVSGQEDEPLTGEQEVYLKQYMELLSYEAGRGGESDED